LNSIILGLLPLLFVTLPAFSAAKTFVGVIEIVDTKVVHDDSTFKAGDFVGKKVRITLRIDSDDQINPVRVMQLEDDTVLKGDGWTYGNIFDSLEECVSLPTEECLVSEFKYLLSLAFSRDKSVALSFGNMRDENAQFFSLAGLVRTDYDTKVQSIVAAGTVKDLKYDSGKYIHQVKVELKEVVLGH